MEEASHTESVVELASRPDGRRRWRWRGREFSEVRIQEGDGDGPTSEEEVDSGLLTSEFRATLAPQQRTAFDAILSGSSAAAYARKCHIDGSVARRRFQVVRRKFGEWLRDAGLILG